MKNKEVTVGWRESEDRDGKSGKGEIGDRKMKSVVA